MPKLTNATDSNGNYTRLSFPEYAVLKPWLVKHFGPDHYTDDVEVVDPAIDDRNDNLPEGANWCPSSVAAIVEVQADGILVNHYIWTDDDEGKLDCSYRREFLPY